MSAVITRSEQATPGTRALSTRAIRNGAVWLLFFSGFLVFIEPAPFELVFGLVAIIFLLTGLNISILLLPLIILLLLYNLGGGVSLMPVVDEPRAVWFVVISIYMAVMAVVIACIFAQDTQRRLDLMINGYTWAALLGSLLGIMGYFDVAGTLEVFTLYGRASGSFKDPNVFSTFLVLPIVFLVQGFFLGTHRRPVLAGMVLLNIAFGLFLSFSRGAWAVTVGAVILCVGLNFITESSSKMRLRLVAISVVGLVLLVLLLVIALQFDAIRETFEVRASLDQDYDQGESGRFGSQLRAIPLLLERPNGFGPTFFRVFLGVDPHNTFVNAFASYGWLGGISYLALIAITMMLGWKLVFRKTPWQRASIVIWSSFFMLILQGMQIDTDHWRHFYVHLGLTWGLTLASLRYQAWSQAAPAPRAGWSVSTDQTAG